MPARGEQGDWRPLAPPPVGSHREAPQRRWRGTRQRRDRCPAPERSRLPPLPRLPLWLAMRRPLPPLQRRLASGHGRRPRVLKQLPRPQRQAFPPSKLWPVLRAPSPNCSHRRRRSPSPGGAPRPVPEAARSLHRPAPRTQIPRLCLCLASAAPGLQRWPQCLTQPQRRQRQLCPLPGRLASAIGKVSASVVRPPARQPRRCGPAPSAGSAARPRRPPRRRPRRNRDPTITATPQDPRLPSGGLSVTGALTPNPPAPLRHLSPLSRRGLSRTRSWPGDCTKK